MTDSVIARPGADLAYDVEGDGPVLGYSHGIFSSRAAEQRLDLLDWSPVTARHTFVRYDARAHGQSTGRAEPDDYRWSSLAADLLALATEVGGGGPVDWAGQSMGTGTLLWAATREPELFRKLVLMIPPTTGETRVAAASMYRAGAAMVEQSGKAPWIAQMRRFPPPEIFADVPTYRADADVAEPLLPALLRGAAASDLPPVEALATLPQPTLILAWETDPIHPVSTAEHLSKTLLDVRLHVSPTTADIRTWPTRTADFLAE